MKRYTLNLEISSVTDRNHQRKESDTFEDLIEARKIYKQKVCEFNGDINIIRLNLIDNNTQNVIDSWKN